MSRFLLIFVSAATFASAAETLPALKLFTTPTTAESRLQAMKNALQPSAAAKKGGLSHLSLTQTKPQMAQVEHLCAIPLTAVHADAKADAAMTYSLGAGADQPMVKAPLMPVCR